MDYYNAYKYKGLPLITFNPCIEGFKDFEKVEVTLNGHKNGFWRDKQEKTYRVIPELFIQKIHDSRGGSLEIRHGMLMHDGVGEICSAWIDIRDDLNLPAAEFPICLYGSPKDLDHGSVDSNPSKEKMAICYYQGNMRPEVIENVESYAEFMERMIKLPFDSDKRFDVRVHAYSATLQELYYLNRIWS